MSVVRSLWRSETSLKAYSLSRKPSEIRGNHVLRPLTGDVPFPASVLPPYTSREVHVRESSRDSVPTHERRTTGWEVSGSAGRSPSAVRGTEVRRPRSDPHPPGPPYGSARATERRHPRSRRTVRGTDGVAKSRERTRMRDDQGRPAIFCRSLPDPIRGRSGTEVLKYCTYTPLYGQGQKYRRPPRLGVYVQGGVRTGPKVPTPDRRGSECTDT